MQYKFRKLVEGYLGLDLSNDDLFLHRLESKDNMEIKKSDLQKYVDSEVKSFVERSKNHDDAKLLK